MTQKTTENVADQKDLSVEETDIDDGSDLFDDGEPEAVTGGQAKADDPQKIVAPVSDKIKIKYNGNDEEYSVDEIVPLAQMGRNYPKIKEELDAVRNSEEMKTLAEIAKESGFKDVKSFAQELKTNLFNAKVDRRASELVSEGMKPEHAKKMAELELSQSSAKAQEQSPVDEGQKQAVNAYLELFQEFPETAEWDDLSKFPPEVRDQINAGKNPVVAYTKYLTAKAEKEKAIAIQNADARSRDTGSLGSNNSDEKDDPFLQGFGD